MIEFCDSKSLIQEYLDLLRKSSQILQDFETLENDSLQARKLRRMIYKHKI